MTTHIRTQIRDALASAVTGLASTGEHVHKSYLLPQPGSAVPFLLVTLNGREEIVGGDVSGALERDLTVIVGGYTKTTGDVDAALNTLALEIETAIAAQPTLGGKCAAIWLNSIESGIDQSLDKPVGRIELTYRIKYFTIAGSPGTLI